MDIVLKNITVRELVENYQDNQEAGIVGFGGKLNIRPPYQREFVYSDKQRKAVIDTITRGFPINTMYWAVSSDGFEIIDGQQRTVSICQYCASVFSYEERYFHNLEQDEKDRILDYKLTVYQCWGTDSEKLGWFRTINIAGEKLTEQELRNAVYAGSWTADAKRYFSKTQCAAWQLADKYMTGSPIRQDYLETAISWISEGNVTNYMAMHQNDNNANPLWLYFQSVINWINATFPKYRKEMKGITWGILYNAHKGDQLDPGALEAEITRLMADDDVTKKSGSYEYVLNRKERTLSIRAFTGNQKREAYERQKGICPACGNYFEIDGMEADHITPWCQGGKTIADNCQMLCKMDNRTKSGK
ncbi:HNH endonuclease [Pectobacterium carotovorum subsp. carotovorum]|nr:HNH endonuclease [Pectobacterium carotovorum subsp. carotovorum]KML71159.1 HNH endonuclease [Pectobacterium carotovorum subsp. carotovorum ICMP 5702]SHG56088.1 HNH endonuclease [Pectobacterium carotovorum]